MSEHSDLDAKVNAWFGLPSNWQAKAQISYSFYEALRKRHNELKRLGKQIEGKSLGERLIIEQKLKQKTKEYWKLFYQGPTFG